MEFKFKDLDNIKIYNYVNFDGFKLTLDDVVEFINNLTYDDIDLNEYNLFEFKECNEFVDIYFYINVNDNLVINIDGIY